MPAPEPAALRPEPWLNHLLIVEDDDGLAELFRQELEVIGLPIQRAATGAEAIGHLTARPDCLVLLDYSLPDMTARSMIEHLAKQGPVPPFIVTTGHGDERVAVSMMKLGARDYLVKDTLLLERLRTVVERVLREIESQRRLAESECRYQALFESSNDGIMLLDGERFIDCNRRTLEFFGLASKDGFLGHHPAELSPPRQPDGRDSLSAARDYIRIAHERGACRFEWMHRRHDATDLPCEVQLSTLELGGRPLMQATVRDISERHRATTALRESEERYRYLLGSVTDYLYVVEIENGRPIATSHGAGCVSVTGFSPEDYGRQPFLWLDMVPPDDRPAVEHQAAAALRGEIPEPVEHRIHHKDGSLRWVRNTLVPRHDAAGRLVACDGLISDITERKQAEETVRAQLDELRRWQSVMMGREDRVRALKTEVNDLLRRQGEPIRYPSAAGVSPEPPPGTP